MKTTEISSALGLFLFYPCMILVYHFSTIDSIKVKARHAMLAIDFHAKTQDIVGLPAKAMNEELPS